MQDTTRQIPIVDGVAAVSASAQAWVCDIWGVVHNGVAAFPSAVDALTRFRARGGIVLLLTNAPRPAPAIEAQLQRLGVPRAAFDAVLTSGDLTRSLIADRAGRPLYHLGPERDRGLFEGQNVSLVDLEGAAAIVCSGLFDDETETAEHYRARLMAPASRGVPMICANPDLTVARGDRIIPCAGAIAALYETMGGTVIYAGKPHLPIYERAFAVIDEVAGRAVPRSAIQAIGDGVNTDIRGAIAAGLDAVFVASAVHVTEPLSDASLARLYAGFPKLPVAALPALAW